MARGVHFPRRPPTATTMSLRYRDYYETLGVARDATPEQIQKAFRDLARKFHPDVNKDPAAADRFKEVNEAYEVLKDPEKRKRFDQLGSAWQSGQEFTPPPGFENFRFEFDGGSGGAADFSDFFASLFGAHPGFGGQGAFGGRRTARASRGDDVEAELSLTVEELVRGAKTEVRLRDPEDGVRTLEVALPPGTTQGTRIRLGGQGGRSRSGGANGDLYLRVAIAPHSRFTIDGNQLRMQLDLAPWEAALGARLDVALIDATVALEIAPGSQSGQTLRLRGQGLPQSQGGRGDLLVKLRIVVPRDLSDDERALYEQLRDRSKFRPRG
ncbi:MAG: DnaJ C-terminal domain-containing protein [Planctomycetota bacterium]